MEKQFESLMDTIGYHFKDQNLLRTALTHSSYANENKHIQSYERLEFMGDSILSFFVSTYIYDIFQDLPEGDLSKMRASLVCEQSLAQCAVKNNFSPYLILSRGEELTGGRERPSILADVFESILAAIYLDGGIEPARKFVMDNLKAAMDDGSQHAAFKDYKTALQEKVQHGDSNVEYVHIKEEGPEHSKIFTVRVLFEGKVLAEGRGKSKKDAEQDAARGALEHL